MFKPVLHYRKPLALAGSFVLVAVVLLAVGTMLIGPGGASKQAVEFSATYRNFDTVDALRKESVAVVVGQVVGAPTTELVAPSIPPQLPAHQPHQTSKPGVTQPTPGHASRQPGDSSARGVPVTTYSLQVTQVLSGTMTPGQVIHVKQLGGTLPLPTGVQTTFEDAHDPLLRPNEPQVLFLGENADGSHFIVGGPQGRLKVRTGRVYPVDPSAPVAKGHAGELLEEFAARITRR
jgi:hypothetical protein